MSSGRLEAGYRIGSDPLRQELDEVRRTVDGQPAPGALLVAASASAPTSLRPAVVQTVTDRAGSRA